MRRDVRKALVCAAVLLCSTTAFAGEGPGKGEPDAQSPPKLQSRVFQLKNGSARAIVLVLQPLRSDVPGGAVTGSDVAHAIAVRETPENLALIEDAIRRLDAATPAAAPADIEVRLYILMSGTAPTAELPGLAPAFARLERQYGDLGLALLAPVVQRTRADESGGFLLTGQAAYGDSTASYDARADHISRSVDASGASRVDLHGLTFDLKAEGGAATVASDVSVRLGEPAVVGLASLPHGKSVALVLVVDDAAGR